MASLFTLYHQPSQTTAGSQGFAETANLDDYLFARSMIAWKLNGKRPSPAVDFYRSINANPTPFNTLDTCARLNAIHEVHGNIYFNGRTLAALDVKVEGVQNSKFSSTVYKLNLSNYSTTEPSQDIAVRGTYSFPLVTGETVSYHLSCPGYTITPNLITVTDFSKDQEIHIRIRKPKAPPKKQPAKK
jgi:hypothetical protein